MIIQRASSRCWTLYSKRYVEFAKGDFCFDLTLTSLVDQRSEVFSLRHYRPETRNPPLLFPLPPFTLGNGGNLEVKAVEVGLLGLSVRIAPWDKIEIDHCQLRKYLHAVRIDQANLVR